MFYKKISLHVSSMFAACKKFRQSLLGNGHGSMHEIKWFDTISCIKTARNCRMEPRGSMHAFLWGVRSAKV